MVSQEVAIKANPCGFKSLEDSMINVYDFDGVLCDPIEDCIFRLDESWLDNVFITLGRQRYGITNLSENTKRNRHLILQEVLYEQGKCPEPGPMFDQLMSSTDPFFVLTARSGPGAVARVSQFFERYEKRPEEMFFVGPVSKNHMLIDLCEKFPDTTVRFYDDTQYHIDHANELGYANLEAVWVDNKVTNLAEEARDYYGELVAWLQKR